jgi:catechol 2,3-dioxygenase-like lactoylglutathione lyase family enzyme
MTTENRNAQTIGVSMEGLTLRVADIERSLAFYKMIPGVEEIVHRPGQFALLSVGKGMVGCDLQELLTFRASLCFTR